MNYFDNLFQIEQRLLIKFISHMISSYELYIDVADNNNKRILSLSFATSINSSAVFLLEPVLSPVIRKLCTSSITIKQLSKYFLIFFLLILSLSSLI